MEQERTGFFKTLFNWDFTEFLTVRVIKATYIVWVVLTAIYLVVGEYYCARYLSGAERIGGIVLVPIIALFLLIYIRVILELTFVYFRSERHLRRMASIASNSVTKPR